MPTNIQRFGQRMYVTYGMSDGSGNFNFGQSMPDIREGDTLQPGMPVADILDLSEVEVWAKVGAATCLACHKVGGERLTHERAGNSRAATRPFARSVAPVLVDACSADRHGRH